MKGQLDDNACEARKKIRTAGPGHAAPAGCLSQCDCVCRQTHTLPARCPAETRVTIKQSLST